MIVLNLLAFVDGRTMTGCVFLYQAIYNIIHVVIE